MTLRGLIKRKSSPPPPLLPSSPIPLPPSHPLPPLPPPPPSPPLPPLPPVPSLPPLPPSPPLPPLPPLLPSPPLPPLPPIPPSPPLPPLPRSQSSPKSQPLPQSLSRFPSIPQHPPKPLPRLPPIGPPTCPNCENRPVAPKPTAGQYFEYCSKACARRAGDSGADVDQKEGQTRSLCEHCKQKPKFEGGSRVHPYCGLKCARLATNSHSTQVNPRMNLRERGCISCRAVPRDGGFVLCQPCHNGALSRAPVLIKLLEDHENYKGIETQFKQSWRHKTTCPEVKAVYKIIVTEASLRQYQQYLDNVEARGNFVAMGKSRGNENRRWHGTKRKCRLGDPGYTTFCAEVGCSLCRIIKLSFDVKFFKSGTGWGRFGHGIYTSSTSSKANDYSKNVGITSDWKALLLNKVVVGNGKKLTRDLRSLVEPPPGYDSVLGEVVPSGALNYDELVVYRNEAVRPSYLVMYKCP